MPKRPKVKKIPKSKFIILLTTYQKMRKTAKGTNNSRESSAKMIGLAKKKNTIRDIPKISKEAEAREWWRDFSITSRGLREIKSSINEVQMKLRSSKRVTKNILHQMTTKDQRPLLALKLISFPHPQPPPPHLRIWSRRPHLKRASQTSFISTRRRANRQSERNSSKRESPTWKTSISDLYWGR